MDDSHSNGSPYINEIDLQPPSPAGSHQLGLYSADYHNSPYSSHSDLSFGGDVQHSPALALFSDDGYDPTEFDNPNSGSSLLMFEGPASDDYYNFYRSPSPSGSDNNHEENPSGASSASSNTHFSPNMAMAHSFENLSFQSPNWGTDPLPGQNKAASPPRLLIADQQVPIVVNAPDDNTDLGPSLNVVPATPIAGGIGAVNMVNQQRRPTSNWLEPDAQSGFSSRSVSPAHSGATTPGPSRSPSASPQPNHLLLEPQPPRSRSRSDTNVEPPNWDNITGGDGFPQNHPSQQAYQTGTAHPPTLGANFTFGGPSANGSINAAPTNNGFLSPEYPEFNLTGLRRSKSDAGGPGRHRGSRSEDFRFSDQFLPGAGQAAGPGLNFPPSAHNDFIRSQQLQQTQQLQSQFLQPDVMRPSHSHSQSLSAQYPGHVPNITSSPNLSANNNNRHYRRASSGTRSERGPSAGDWDGGLGHSNRASPYPSPHASPRGRPMPLTQDEYSFNGMAGGLTADMAANLGPKIPTSGTPYTHVSKPNVTTVRTVNASQKRRKQEATFVCPVPGCNSTFTRSFNLKGHIRSHNEEKPFQCHWPGCGKGFARQHDCKRHEQLHTNYRPFNCDGCKKQFARMDALNRHLRSEGGAECAKLQEANGGSAIASSPPGSAAKTESNAGLKSPPSTSGTTLCSDAASTDTMTAYTTRQSAALRSGRPKLEDSWGVGVAVAL